MSMSDYMVKINPFPIYTARRKLLHEKEAVDELKAYRGLAGKPIWVGGAILPQASNVDSFMQQRTHQLTIEGILKSNGMLK